YKGKPVEKGMITFFPAGGAGAGRAAWGTIADGFYSLSTAGNDDGSLPGKYAVTITAKDVDLASSPMEKGQRMPDQISTAKVNSEAKSLIPRKYSRKRDSFLTREVKAETNRFDFELAD